MGGKDEERWQNRRLQWYLASKDTNLATIYTQKALIVPGFNFKSLREANSPEFLMPPLPYPHGNSDIVQRVLWCTEEREITAFARHSTWCCPVIKENKMGPNSADVHPWKEHLNEP